jgi:hypothetical protein
MENGKWKTENDEFIGFIRVIRCWTNSMYPKGGRVSRLRSGARANPEFWDKGENY